LPEQYIKSLKKISIETGLNISEIIRRAIYEYIMKRDA